MLVVGTEKPCTRKEKISQTQSSLVLIVGGTLHKQNGTTARHWSLIGHLVPFQCVAHALTKLSQHFDDPPFDRVSLIGVQL